MKKLKKLLRFLFMTLLLPLSSCKIQIYEYHNLFVVDYGGYIVNRYQICNRDYTYGLYKAGDQITFEIDYYSEMSVSLMINDEEYKPVYKNPWEIGYINYVMPDHDVNVHVLICGNPVDDPEYGTYKLEIIDKYNLIFDKPVERYGYFPAGTRFVFHCNPLTDVDLGMYVDNELYSLQYPMYLDGREVWEYEFIMPHKNVTIEFEIVSDLLMSYVVDWASEIKDENLLYMDVEEFYIGVAPDHERGLGKRVYNENSMITSWLNQTYVRPTEYFIEGGKGQKVKFVLKEDKEFALYILKGYLYYDSFYYAFVDELPSWITEF